MIMCYKLSICIFSMDICDIEAYDEYFFSLD
jgi:hypothetical protein